MTNLSYKYKIICLAALWVASVLILFGFVFSWFENGNAGQADLVLRKRKEFLELQEEQKSYIQGKQDLENLNKRVLLPEDFFSRDTSLVREIQSLEALAAANDLKITFGISGTSSLAQKARTKGELLVIPYSMQITGDFPDAYKFVYGLENISFITHVKNVSLNATGKGEVSITSSAVFYIKK